MPRYNAHAVLNLSTLLSLTPFFTIVLVGCHAPDAGASETPQEAIVLGSTRSAIVNGTADSGHPAVGVHTGDGYMCTATLIGHKTVLTAAHCVDKEPKTQHFEVGGVTYQVVAATAFPGWDGPQPPDPIDGPLDMGVLILDRAVPIPAAVVATRTPAIGAEVSPVGFGSTCIDGDPTDPGVVKRITRSVIDRLSQTYVQTAVRDETMGTSCSGDSGGPIFGMQDGVEVEMGVTSGGDHATMAYYSRVDTSVGWIKSVAAGDLNDGSDPHFNDRDAGAPPNASSSSGGGGTSNTNDNSKANGEAKHSAATPVLMVSDGGCAAASGRRPTESSILLALLAAVTVLARRRRATAANQRAA